jgi:polysaccharide pyruvyl transferase WcaK-like protein
VKVLVLWADTGSANLGVRVLAEGTADLVRSVWPDADVTHQDFGSRLPALPIGSLGSLARERVLGTRGAAEWLAGFDLVVDTRSGDSFTDIYGLRRLAVMTGVAELVRQSRTPLVLGPQTIGPFRSRAGRRMGTRALHGAAAVLARDSVSAEYAASLGRPADLLTTDVVFAIRPPRSRPERDVVLNVSGLLWQENPHVDHRRYRAVVSSVFEELSRRGRTVTLLAHVLASGSRDDDVPAIREFAELHPDVAGVVVPESLQEVREVVAGASLVIGSRMHACLNALSCGTPAVALAYSRKFAPLLGDLGWSAVVELSDDDPAAAVLSLSDDAGLAQGVDGVLERAHGSLERAKVVLRSAG